ncbi:EF-hand domain-containing family member C2-like isoform X1 [Drosophila miranda]|uniref:EF-hand domain-containing family member C2-like isoform X1 n=1 Tax=Drosophila miranda TaxID=7229 RepID=UPI00143F0CC1|nr:EF-hand domain-containing family member C2-like isoform X1 [Drosophila miranda]
MLRLPGMPLLPGAQFYDYGKRRHPRQQTLMHYQGIQMLSDHREPDPKCPPMPAEINTLWAPKVTTKLPPWLTYDKQVLCFNENLTEIYYAPYQVRKVRIYFYLEDGTMQVTVVTGHSAGLSGAPSAHTQGANQGPGVHLYL